MLDIESDRSTVILARMRPQRNATARGYRLHGLHIRLCGIGDIGASLRVATACMGKLQRRVRRHQPVVKKALGCGAGGAPHSLMCRRCNIDQSGLLRTEQTRNARRRPNPQSDRAEILLMLRGRCPRSEFTVVAIIKILFSVAHLTLPEHSPRASTNSII